MISFMNTGITVSFSFGECEDKSIYARHYDVFQQKLGIDLSIYILESDQGVALKSICIERGIKHLACNRHLLVSIKYSRYSRIACQIVACESQLELNNIIEKYQKELEPIKDREKLREINTILKKNRDEI